MTLSFFGRTKWLSPQELGAVRALHDLIRTERYKTEVVRKDTLQVENGQAYVKTQDGLLKLLEQEREQLITRIAQRLELTGAVSVDLETGKIWIQK